MRWEGGRQGGNIEDRRGMSPIGLAGGGIGGLVIAAVLYFTGMVDNPGDAVRAGNQLSGALNGGSAQGEATTGSPSDLAARFVDIIGANIDDVWSRKLSNYTAPTTVLYTEGTQTGCGLGQAAMGPFYCPNDRKVYLDLSFWQELERMGGSGGDFARAYVLAHEFGHHVQTLTGISAEVQRAQQAAGSQAEANRYSVALELQADCFAGVWARNAASVSNGQVAVEAGDIEQGMQTASAIGDDTLQRKSSGRVAPDAFTHGSSAQRVEWLRRGYDSGDPARCDTLSGV